MKFAVFSACFLGLGYVAIVFEPEFMQTMSRTDRLAVLGFYQWLLAFPFSVFIMYLPAIIRGDVEREG